MLSSENEALLDSLISQNVNVAGGRLFTVYYQIRFGSNDVNAYRAYDGEKVTVNLGEYTKVADVRCKNIEDVYMKMQGEHWSPQGEARPIIKELGLCHTSLSVGDLVQDKEGVFFICAPIGFNKVRVTI